MYACHRRLTGALGGCSHRHAVALWLRGRGGMAL